MRVLLSTYGSRGDVEPRVDLAVQLGALGAEVRVWAPPNFAELIAGDSVPPVTGTTPPSGPRTCPRAWPSWSPRSSTRSPRAEGCDALVATGVMPAGVWL